MADLTITAANVGLKSQSVSVQVVQFGEAVTQGQPLYRDTNDNKYNLCDSDAEASAKCAGIAMTSGATDEYGIIAKTGPIDVGATLTVGETYVVSTNAGGIAPIGDLTTGDYVTHLGVASAAATLELDIEVTGVVKP